LHIHSNRKLRNQPHPGRHVVVQATNTRFAISHFIVVYCLDMVLCAIIGCSKKSNRVG